jgi:succinate-semialdehyde dehydrogenase/glutarate-semialdehyde dehydrogenase
VIGTVAIADRADLALAADAALRGFETWRDVSAFERSAVLRAAAAVLPLTQLARKIAAALAAGCSIVAKPQTGMPGVNHMAIFHAETPFGGVKDCGCGSDGGSEALRGYFQPQLVTVAVD